MRKIVIGTSVILLLLSGAWWVVAQPPTPSVPAPTLSPNLITVSRPTQVLVTVLIPTPTLNPTSVELYRTGANGASTLLAQLNDTGKNGDLTPGDRTFSTNVTLYESTPSTFGFQVSAIFTGSNRVLSSIQQFAALATTSVPVNLPPDPGEAGKATLAGVDTNVNGVRDDVERVIIFLYPDSAKTRQAGNDIAKAIQKSITSSNNPTKVREGAVLEMRAARCILAVRPRVTTTDLAIIQAALLNTDQRGSAYDDYENLASSVVRAEDRPVVADPSTLCSFVPAALEN